MKFKEILRKDIKENTWNPNFMEVDKWGALVKNIKEFGFNLPVIVREVGKKYEIIDGEHRFKALDDIIIPCLVVDKNDLEAKAMTLGLNNIRGDITNLDMFGDIVKDVFEKYGREKTTELLGEDITLYIEKEEEDISRIVKYEELKTEEVREVQIVVELTKEQYLDYNNFVKIFEGSDKNKIKSLCSEFLLKYK